MYGMNQNYPPPPADPSQVPLVSQHLLSHIHLVSQFRFPQMASLTPQEALEHLVKGPQIVKDAAAVAWTYFQTPPQDGTVFMTWQSPRMGVNYASDGLAWADSETSTIHNIRGYNIQQCHHRAGYTFPHEPFATHARIRYRIVNGPGDVNPALWIVFYYPAEPNDRVAQHRIQLTGDAQQQFLFRQQLEKNGQLVHKPFMLADRQKWPKVEFAPKAAAQHPAFYNPMQPQQRSYTQPPPAKRARPSIPPQQNPPSGVVDALEEEESATLDTFDYLTPRDISQSRYKQHHEWMEEVFSSPYAIGNILPVDLGLGLMGELAPLTVGILDAPAGDFPGRNPKERYDVKSYTKLAPEQMKEFETRVAEYTRKEEAELEEMKAAHAKKMAAMKRSRAYIKAERRLREAPAPSEEGGDDPLDRIVKNLEDTMGVTFGKKVDVVCIDKGGFQEEQQTLTQNVQQVIGTDSTAQNTDAGSNDMLDTVDAENSAASLLEQYGSSSLIGTPGTNFMAGMSQPQSQTQSVVATPGATAADNQPSAPTGRTNMQGSGADDLLNLDVEMSGMAGAEGKSAENDWVMIGQDNGAQQAAGGSTAQTSTNAQTADANSGAATGTAEESAASMFDTGDFGGFDNLDSAGDALADFENVDDNMGLDLVDDSAFGDAFHGTEMHHGEPSNEGNDA